MPAVPDRLQELLATVCEHLAALTTRRHGDEADDGKSQDEADHHAEHECEHTYSVARHAADDKSAHAPRPNCDDLHRFGPMPRWPGVPRHLGPYRWGVPESLPTPPPSSDARPGPTPAPTPRRTRLTPGLRTVTEFLIALTVLALTQAFIVKAYRIPSASMDETLLTGDRILVNRLDSSIGRGDVVVFEHGDTWADTHKSPSESILVNVARAVGSVVGFGPSIRAYTVKRVIATGGETVACCDAEGRITVDGVGLDEDYLGSDFAWEPGTNDCTGVNRSMRCLPEIVVPEGELFLLGDNRTNSADSANVCRGRTDAGECARFVRESQVVGPVVGRFWPPTQIGRLSH